MPTATYEQLLAETMPVRIESEEQYEATGAIRCLPTIVRLLSAFNSLWTTPKRRRTSFCRFSVSSTTFTKL